MLNLKKCRFHAKKINFLNFRIFSIEVSMQKDRMSIVQNWFMSCSYRNVQTFIKFVNFYRRFVNEFFKITANLIDLLKNAINEKFSFKFKMIVEKKFFFKRFKIVFTTVFMLWHFFFEINILFETDLSNFAISNIIFQLFENEKWHSVVYWFKKMTFSERNYVVEKQKLLIIVETCKQWKHYVKNSKHFIKIIINHANFRIFIIIKILNCKKIRWWKRLFELNLKIKHKSNKKNSANKSFRRRDYEIETHVKNEMKNQISKKFFNLKNNVLKIRNWTLIFANDVLKNNSKFISNRLKKNFQKSENNNNFTNTEKKNDRWQIEMQSFFKRKYVKKHCFHCAM